MDERHIIFPNGQKMPLLGLGTWLADDKDELEAAMNAAFDAGYRHFDTAFNYGNEQVVGNVVKSWLDSGKAKREELFIVTKLPCIGMDEGRVQHFLKLSLAALKLDYVDLYLVHGPIGFKYVDDDTKVPMEDGHVMLDMTTDLIKVWKAMEAEVVAGRAKSIGISNFTEAQVERIFSAAEIKPANIQVEATIYLQQKPLRELCAKLGITFCAYSPFGSPSRINYYKSVGLETPDAGPPVLSDPVVGVIAKGHGKTPAQVLLRFLVQQGIAVIPKSTNLGRIAENSQIFDFNLTPVEMKELEALDRGARTITFSLIPGAENHPECPFFESGSQRSKNFQ